jgi:hypothetical protein
MGQENERRGGGCGKVYIEQHVLVTLLFVVAIGEELEYWKNILPTPKLVSLFVC